jgi:hypothetical protein
MKTIIMPPFFHYIPHETVRTLEQPVIIFQLSMTRNKLASFSSSS